MNNTDTTIVSFSQVQSRVESIRKSSQNMERILDDFAANINKGTAEGIFEGSASASVLEKINQLKTKFASYTAKVEEFASSINAAAEAMKETDSALKAAADNLSAQ